MNPLELQVLAAVSGIGGASATPQAVREPLPPAPVPRSIFPQPQPSGH